MTIDGLKEFLSLIDALDQGRLRGMASRPTAQGLHILGDLNIFFWGHHTKSG
jgi:hypothetical protein